MPCFCIIQLQYVYTNALVMIRRVCGGKNGVVLCMHMLGTGQSVLCHQAQPLCLQDATIEEERNLKGNVTAILDVTRLRLDATQTVSPEQHFSCCQDPLSPDMLCNVRYLT